LIFTHWLEELIRIVAENDTLDWVRAVRCFIGHLLLDPRDLVILFIPWFSETDRKSS